LNKDFINIIKKRRSRYNLLKQSPITKNEILDLVKEVTYYVPSFYNAQASRLVVLFDEDHNDFWDITTEILRKKVNNEEKFVRTLKKMKDFKDSYGTILFFEDDDTIKSISDKFPSQRDIFSEWADHSTGMIHLAIWIALADNGLGASLQHYNPIIDETVKERFSIPKSWRLTSEMPFGVSSELDKEKSKVPIEQRVISFIDK
jgi:predicted oxidoreductase (fatty acid repression mutant protein)